MDCSIQSQFCCPEKFMLLIFSNLNFIKLRVDQFEDTDYRILRKIIILKN